MLMFVAKAESGNTGGKRSLGSYSASQVSTIRANASAMRGKGTKSTIKYKDRSAQGKSNVYRGRVSSAKTRG